MGFLTEEDKKFYKGVAIGVAVFLVAILIMVLVLANSGSGSGSSSSTVKCPSCGRVFAKSSADGKNINRTNLCVNCYNNLKWAQNNGLVGEFPGDHSTGENVSETHTHWLCLEIGTERTR